MPSVHCLCLEHEGSEAVRSLLTEYRDLNMAHLPAHLLLELEELAGAAEVPEVAELLPQPLVLRVHRLALQPDLRLRWRILR